MKRIKHRFLLPSFFVCCIAQLSLGQARESVLDSFFCTIDKNGDINGSVFVAENGKTLYQKSFGYADAQNKIPNTANTLFQIASVSKLFTAIAVLQLNERKKINLPDKFSKYFPDFPYPEVTIYQLLSNTSGIPDIGDVFLPLWRLNRDTIFTLNDVIPALKINKLPLNFQAGDAWEYANINYVLAALLVEKVSGEKFDSYLSKYIFQPAGMKNTFQKASGTNPYAHPNVAYNYDLPFRFSITPVRVDSFATNDFKVHYKTFPSEGDANIYTSVLDLANFNKALCNGILLKQNSLNLLFSPSIRNNGKKVTLRGVGSEIGVIGDFYWGFGNRISLDSTMGKIVWESGGMPGCSANVIMNLTKRQLIVWLNNKRSSSAMDNIFGALSIVNNKAVAVKKAKNYIAATYAQLLVQNGEDYAFARLIEMESDTSNYILDENELNELGYEFFEHAKDTLAFAVFRSAIVLFPDSDNLFNSYGELLAKSGKKEEAIIMFKKSLLINPKNEDSKKSLELLEQKEISPDIDKVFLDKTDSTKNCYTVIYPPKLPWKGYLFLIPGFGETAEEVLQQTDLPQKSALNGILTIIPTFQDGVLSFGTDSLSQQSFDKILKDVTAEHKLTDLRFYVGGFSIGGSCTIKYAENAAIKPTAIFAIDPPLDFERFYHSAKRDVRLSKGNEANQEYIYMIDRLEKETGGSPATHLSAYYQLSPYSFSDTTQAAIKKLTNMPLRIYTEPDINWWLKERNADFTNMNATECSAMINELNRLGNDMATFITTQNKGYRKPDNRRHPHSWSIVDNDELIEWLLNQK